jgi:hypothetical protein
VTLAIEGGRHEAEDVLLSQLLHHFGEHRIQVVVHADFEESAAGFERGPFEVAARALGATGLADPHGQAVHDHVAF